jgi:hypothetical protein
VQSDGPSWKKSNDKTDGWGGDPGRIGRLVLRWIANYVDVTRSRLSVTSPHTWHAGVARDVYYWTFGQRELPLVGLGYSEVMGQRIIGWSEAESPKFNMWIGKKDWENFVAERTLRLGRMVGGRSRLWRQWLSRRRKGIRQLKHSHKKTGTKMEGKKREREKKDKIIHSNKTWW